MQNCAPTSSGGEPPITPLSVITMITDVTSGGITLTEGTSIAFNVRLTAAPISAVTVNATSNNSASVAVSPASMTFDANNWNTDQLVTLTAVQNSFMGSSTAQIILSSDFGSLPIDVNVTDDESLSIVLSSSSFTIEEGEVKTIGVKLSTQPLSNVVVDITSSDSFTGPEIGANFSPITFTPDNWNTEVQVSVKATLDSSIENRSGSLSFSASEIATVNSNFLVYDSEGSNGVITEIGEPITCYVGYLCQFRSKMFRRPSPFVENPVTITLEVEESPTHFTPAGPLVFDVNNWDEYQTASLSIAASAPLGLTTVRYLHVDQNGYTEQWAVTLLNVRRR